MKVRFFCSPYKSTNYRPKWRSWKRSSHWYCMLICNKCDTIHKRDFILPWIAYNLLSLILHFRYKSQIFEIYTKCLATIMQDWHYSLGGLMIAKNRWVDVKCHIDLWLVENIKLVRVGPINDIILSDALSEALYYAICCGFMHNN